MTWLYSISCNPSKRWFTALPKCILSLRDVTAKMSKSVSDPNSRTLLTDSHETIIKCIRRTVTDSIPGITCDPVEPPGTSNLLTILSACTGEVPAALAERYAESNHGSLKKKTWWKLWRRRCASPVRSSRVFVRIGHSWRRSHGMVQKRRENTRMK